MQGTFSAKSFDAQTLQKFVRSLQNDGLEFEVIWSKGTKVVDPTDDTANLLKLKYNGKLFFSQFKKAGRASPDHLNDAQRDIFINALRRFKFYTEPEYSLAVLLLGIFLLLQIFLVAPGALARSETLLALTIGLNISLFVGMALYFNAAGKTDNKASVIVAYTLLFFGFVLLSPSSLLCIVLIKRILHRSLYLRVIQSNSESTLDEAENSAS